MKIKDIMTAKPLTLTTDSTVKEAAELMQKNDIGAIPITNSENEKLMGIITDRDIILRCISKDFDTNTTTVKDIMTENVITVCPENSITESSRIMAKNKVRRLPVCENGKVVGMVSLGDISRSKLMFAETAAAFCDICENSAE
ncbi:MAG: CBS domain-containing protein [Clostridia bacterium]|nr:CBS domain-containing protein [Clostridia bacterium]